MPELPEVETTLRGISPHIVGQKVASLSIRQAKLRYPIPGNIKDILPSQKLLGATRRAKYLLLQFEQGNLIIHLGMSGSLRIVSDNTAIEKHDHFDLCFGNGKVLRYRDPRRFGIIDWTSTQVLEHRLLKDLGPEPFDEMFTAEYLFQCTRKRKIPIKTLIMDNHIVVGVGNIYASESLFLSGIRPGRSASRLSRSEANRLVENIRKVLEQAITQGGTTLRDFTNSEGKPGYFAQELKVYGRSGQNCPQCGDIIKSKIIAQRNSFYCPRCQA